MEKSDLNIINDIISNGDSLSEKLQNPVSTSQYIENSKLYQRILEQYELSSEIKKSHDELVSAETMLEETGDDEELRQMTFEEISSLKNFLEKSILRLKKLLLPKDEADENGVMLEIRAGAGGDEASIFAGNLFNMYAKYALINKWQLSILVENVGTVGGYKEIICEIKGKEVFKSLKYESGVHRVQRVPNTESQGRVHTSTSTVAVIPEADEIDVVINDKDLRIDTLRASGAGGQHVNKTDSAIRITHIPSGIVVNQQDNRSQHRNKATAMQILRNKLFELERSRQHSELSAIRKGQVGTGDRSERIRTYNFPQGRITDHRIGLTTYDIEAVMAGETLQNIIDSLRNYSEEQLLKELASSSSNSNRNSN